MLDWYAEEHLSSPSEKTRGVITPLRSDCSNSLGVVQNHKNQPGWC
jgi:hypothetical protein